MGQMVRRDRVVREAKGSVAWARKLAAVLLVLGVLLPTVSLLPEQGAVAGAPLYPDLTTGTPKDLSISTLTISGVRHYVLRFSTQVENRGAGRLEIVVGTGSGRDVYQNVYDAKVGGALVSHTRIGADVVYHPTHNHFHFNDFAEATLLKKDTQGAYVNSGKIGKKSSFCILDYVKVLASASTSVYGGCQANRQGLSVGWADIYYSNLPEQYVDLGTSTLANGDYALRVTADPLNKLAETNNGNNMAVLYFRVTNGQVVTTAAPPTCTLTPATGPGGVSVAVLCNLFPPSQPVDLFWESTSGALLATVTADASGVVRGNVTVPQGVLGVHYIVAKSRASSTSVPSVFQITPGIAISPTSGLVGSTVTVNVKGFAAGESIDIRFYKIGTTRSILATVPTSSLGVASATIVVPSTPFGGHKIEAYGRTSRKVVSVTYSVRPSLVLHGPSGAAGSSVKPSGRGFGSSESVTISIQMSPGTSTTLRSVTSASPGSISATTVNAFVIPAGLAPGVYPITARGTTSGATVTANFTVSGPAAASVAEVEPTPTETLPAPPATPTAAATETPLPTATSEPTATTQPTSPPVEPTPTAEPSPTVAEPTATAELPADPVPAIASVNVIEVEDTVVRLRIETSDAATVTVDYGPDAAYGQTITESAPADGVVLVRIRFLESETTYHYRVTASGPGGESTTEDANFTTEP